MSRESLWTKCGRLGAALALTVAVAGCSLFGGGASEPEEPTGIPEQAQVKRQFPDALFLRPIPGTEREVLSKSYQVGERYTVSIGQPMVGIKNYRVFDRVARAVALEDFEQLCPRMLSPEPGRCDEPPLGAMRGSLGDTYDVRGSILGDGGFLYYVIALPSEGGRAYALADADGYLRPEMYLGWRGVEDERLSVHGIVLDRVESAVPLESAAALFSYETEEQLVAGSGTYVNYELVYQGLGRDPRGPAYAIVYREYRRDGSQEPSYEQVLTFLGSQSEVDLLGMLIAVHSATADAITFTVLGDAVVGAN